MKKILYICLLLTSCSASLTQSRTANSIEKLTLQECLKIENNISIFNSISIGSSAVAAPSGIGILAIDDNKTKLSLGITTVALSAVSVGLQAYSQSLNKIWLRECSNGEQKE